MRRRTDPILRPSSIRVNHGLALTSCSMVQALYFSTASVLFHCPGSPAPRHLPPPIKFKILLFFSSMSNRDWFISPLSRPGFGILNDNSDSQQPIPQPLGPKQAIYLNNLRYREPHTNVAAHDSSLIGMPAPETPTCTSRTIQMDNLYGFTNLPNDGDDLSQHHQDEHPQNSINLHDVTGGVNHFNSKEVMSQLNSSQPDASRPNLKKKRRTKKEMQEALSIQKSDCTKDGGKRKKSFDRNPPFVLTDFENICTYLECEDNYNDLFGDGKKTAWGKKKHTRGQAFKRLAMFLNVNHVEGTLNLSGRNAEQRWRTYKQRFMDTWRFLNSTGAGISSHTQGHLQEEIALQCPCFERMAAIFSCKANVCGPNVSDTTAILGPAAFVPSEDGVLSEDENSDNVSLTQSDIEDSSGHISKKGDSIDDSNGKDDIQSPAHHSGESEGPTEPRFIEIPNREGSARLRRPSGRAGAKDKENLEANGKLADRLVSKKAPSILGVIERQLETHDKQMVLQMRNTLQYNYDHDQKVDNAKMMEMKETKEIRMIEINFQRETQQAQWEKEAEHMKRKEEIQFAEMELKREDMHRSQRERDEELALRKNEITQREKRLENEMIMNAELRKTELAHNDRRLAHEIETSGRAGRLDAIIRLHKEGFSPQQIEEFLKLI
ncbi:hypothetical protein O181_009675 [Austropuccinia psidii MF-1]|uniref:Uncharacterized protein n=1 Tax=Austropuccinia psidii MF-1 TaxID=1389203 RepID=A0A9Q3GK53_9BASI|nr:hypothetical protein [Austropuccinia psidii MF-1]